MNLKTNIIIIILILLALFLSFFITFNLAYAEKIYPGIKITGIELNGLTMEEAETLLAREIDWWNKNKIILEYEDKKWEINPEDLGISISANENAAIVFNSGRDKNLWLKLKEQIEILFKGKNLKIAYHFQGDKFNECIKNNLGILETQPINAGIIFEDENFNLTKSKNGIGIKKDILKNNIDEKTKALSSSAIQINLETIFPEVDDRETEKAKAKAIEIIETKFKLKYESDDWILEKEKIISWLKFLPVEENEIPKIFPRVFSNKILGVGVNEKLIGEYLTSIAPTINQEPVNADLTMKNGKAAVFALSQNGIKLSVEKNIYLIESEILNPLKEKNKTKEIALIVAVEKPEITTESIENLGITALIGKGESNFYGSPRNRRHNISVGAARFHGVLIKPNEEFSFNKTLGKVRASTGYKPELVIKKNKTVPEYGGGLCQVSTTCFRAALNSGLPITERSPHAYPVRYYNPQGTDATIYPPHPDLRFINDTPSNILIQTKIKGNILSFEFYGTDDNREVKIIGPYIYDKKASGAMKATLTQEIYRNGELIKKDTFRSIYSSPANYPHRSPLE